MPSATCSCARKPSPLAVIAAPNLPLSGVIHTRPLPSAGVPGGGTGAVGGGTEAPGLEAVAESVTVGAAGFTPGDGVDVAVGPVPGGDDESVSETKAKVSATMPTTATRSWRRHDSSNGISLPASFTPPPTAAASRQAKPISTATPR